MIGLAPRRRVLHRSAAVLIFFVGPGLCVQAAAQRATETSSLALTHVTVIDGTGAAAQTDQTVIIAGNRIAAIGPSGKIKVSPGVQTIDGRRKYLIPGLWDVHVHTRYDGIDHLRLSIANGITSVRDMGAPWSHVPTLKTWKAEIAAGNRVGPRIWMAGPILDGPGSVWTHSAIVANPVEGRQAVQRLKAEGADFVKVYELLSRESFFAIADEARARGLSFVGHIPQAITVIEAADAGQRSIEHASSIVRYLRFPEPTTPVSNVLASAPGQDIIQSLKRNHTVIVPTLSLAWTTAGSASKDPLVTEADRLRYIPAAYVTQWRAQTANLAAGSAVQALDRQFGLVRKLHDERVVMMAGTDVIKPFFVTGFALHDELRLLVQAGLTPLEAIQAASREPARFMRQKDVGTIETGMLADLVLLNADPLKDIANTRQIDVVVANGRIFDKAALKAMLADIEENARTWKGTPTGR